MLTLIKQFGNIPAGINFKKYQSSPDLFDPDKSIIYTVHYKGKDIIIPSEYVSFESYMPLPPETSLSKALDLLIEAEEMLYDEFLVGKENKFKAFLLANGITIDHAKRKCKDCKLITLDNEASDYCSKCVWGHEPGY